MALTLLDNVLDKTEIPCRIIFLDDGNEVGVLEGVRIFAKEHPKVPMVVIRNRESLGWARCVAQCREQVSPQHDYFALLSPEYLIESAQWFGHFVSPLQRDGVCYAAVANPELAWNSLPPTRLPTNNHIRRSFAMFKRKSNPPIPVGEAANFGADLALNAKMTGNTVWEVPSVRVKHLSAGLHTFVALSEAELKRRSALPMQVVINR